MRRDIKILLAQCGLMQKDLLPVIRENGYTCDNARLSRIVNGKSNGEVDYKIEKVIVEYMLDLIKKERSEGFDDSQTRKEQTYERNQ